MSKPTILTVDDDPQVAAAITRDLGNQYGADYRIVRASSGPEALGVLTKLNLRDDPVALIAADQRMPEMTGIEMLRQAQAYAPGAKLLLLTAYADTDVAINAINDIGLDYYLLKPWDPPEERLYPIIDDLLDDWRKANPDHSSDVRVIGHRWSDRSHEIKMFLARNHVPYRWYDVERDAEGERLRQLAQAATDDLPLVLIPDGETLRSPLTLGLAAALGLHTSAQQPLYDVCIVGGGPAGLAAAVYAASEGLSTVIVEREAPWRPGRDERGDRELPRFSKGLERLRPRTPRDSAGFSFWCRDGSRARGRRLREPRTGTRCALRWFRRNRKPCSHRRYRRLLSAAGGDRARRAHRTWCLLRHGSRRGEPMPG